MTDDGQAQNSLHEINSNCVGLMGWGGGGGGGERDWGPDLPRFHRVTKPCRTRSQPVMHFKTLEKLCRIP